MDMFTLLMTVTGFIGVFTSVKTKLSASNMYSSLYGNYTPVKLLYKFKLQIKRLGAWKGGMQVMVLKPEPH